MAEQRSHLGRIVLATSLLLFAPALVAQSAAERAVEDALSRSRGEPSSSAYRPPAGTDRLEQRLRQENRQRLDSPTQLHPESVNPDKRFIGPHDAVSPRRLPPRIVTPADLWIEQQAYSRLRDLRVDEAIAVQVDVQSGVVRLRGAVAGEQERQRMVEEIQTIPGVKQLDASGLRVQLPER